MASTINLYFYVLYILILLIIYISNTQGAYENEEERYVHIPAHDIFQSNVYLRYSNHGEMIVAHAEKTSDFKLNDYLVHADGIRFLTGSSLYEFIKSGIYYISSRRSIQLTRFSPF